MDANSAKIALRREVRSKIGRLTAFEREEASAKACAILESSSSWKAAKSILFYAPLPQEVNIWAALPEALNAGKTILLPKFDAGGKVYFARQIKNLETDLLPGQFGINEPNHHCPEFPLNQLDLTLVPGIAFDLRGGRLGRGGGFYDRLLAQVSGIKCGIAFDEQITAEVPLEPHDVLLDCILTPTRWQAANKRVD